MRFCWKKSKIRKNWKDKEKPKISTKRQDTWVSMRRDAIANTNRTNIPSSLSC